LAVKKLEDIATQKGKEAGEKAAQERVEPGALTPVTKNDPQQTIYFCRDFMMGSPPPFFSLRRERFLLHRPRPARHPLV
jgi:hypothetical protein